jgi:hypothetical protein
MKFILMVLFLLIAPALVSSQEWGKISPEELAMTDIAEDPEADAVVLFDKGEIITTSELHTIFKYYCRMKILTENGKEYGDIRIPYLEGTYVANLEAQSFLPDGRKIKMPRSDIHDQQVRNWNLKVFAIPGVEVGSVLEYRYEIESKFIGYIRPWYFQNREFTRYSEIKLSLTEGLSFNTFMENVGYYNPVKTEGTGWDISKKGKRTAVHTWQLSDIPAIKSEPYMHNNEDYMAKIQFQFVAYQDAYNHIVFLKTWDDMAKRYSELYQNYLALDPRVNALAADLTKSDSSEISKIRSLYDYVRNEVETEDNDELYPENFKHAFEIIDTKKGKPVEKNLLLINLLKNAGLRAAPLMISTRTNGKFKPAFVTYLQLDYLLVAAWHGEEILYLDTQNRFCPFGMLPENSAVGEGLLFEQDKGSIIAIPRTGLQNGIEINTAAQLIKDGTLTLSSTWIYTGYPAVEQRHRLNGAVAADVMKDRVKEFLPDAVIDSVAISNLENIYQPLIIRTEMTIPNYFQITGNMAYFTPPFLDRINANPFKSVKRTFPVDYAYPVNRTENIKIKLPAGFTLNEALPKSKMSFQNISFNMFSFAAESEVEIQRIFKISKESFPVAEYKNLRLLYNEMVSAYQKQIILSIK